MPPKWTSLSPGVSRCPSCYVPRARRGKFSPQLPGVGASGGCFGNSHWLARWRKRAEGSTTLRPLGPLIPVCCRGATAGHKNIWERKCFWGKASKSGWSIWHLHMWGLRDHGLWSWHGEGVQLLGSNWTSLRFGLNPGRHSENYSHHAELTMYQVLCEALCLCVSHSSPYEVGASTLF